MLGSRDQRERDVGRRVMAEPRAERRCCSSRSRRATRGRCRSLLRRAADRRVRPAGHRTRVAQRRSPRQRPPRRGAEDVRIRDRSSRPRRGRAAVRPETLLERHSALPRSWRRESGALASAAALSRQCATEASPASRIAAQLQTIDRALRRFQQHRQSPRQRRRRLPMPGAGSTQLTAALRTPVETAEYPDQRFALQVRGHRRCSCALSRVPDGRMLAAFAWRGTEVRRVVAALAPEQFVEIAGARPRSHESMGGHSGLHLPLAHRSLQEAMPRRTSPPARAASTTSYARAPNMRGISRRTRSVRRRSDRRRADSGHGGATMSDGRSRRRSERCSAARGTASAGRRAVPRITEAQSDAQAMRPRACVAGRTASSSAALASTSASRSISRSIRRCRSSPSAIGLRATPGATDVCRALWCRAEGRRPRVRRRRLLERRDGAHGRASRVIDVETGRIEGARRRAVAVHATGVRRPGLARRVATARLPYADPLSAGRAAEPGRLPRRDARLDDQADHGGGVPRRPRRSARAWLAERTRRHDAIGRPPFRRSRACADNSRAPTRARFSIACSARITSSRPCARPCEIQAMARAFGWNDGACREPSDRCGKHDLLFGARRRRARATMAASRPLALDIPYGRLLGRSPSAAKAEAPFRLRPELALDRARCSRCCRRRRRRAVHAATTGEVPQRASSTSSPEGWGQGRRARARSASPGMMAHARRGRERPGRGASAASGRRAARRGPPPTAAAPDRRRAREPRRREPNRIPHEAAEVIIERPVLQPPRRAPRASPASRSSTRARARAWTGSPARPARRRFPTTTRSLSELARLCAPGAGRRRRERDRDACGPLRPYKWYVAAYRTDPDDPRWTKAIARADRAQLVRRRPGASTAPATAGPNPAAEIAHADRRAPRGRDPGTSR